MTFDKTVAQSKVDDFNAKLMSEYQHSGALKSAVESKRIGVFGDETGPSGPKASNLMLKPQSWSDGQYLSIFPYDRVQDDDMEDAACNMGQAAARREEQLVLDALASAGTLSAVGAVGADVTSETLAQAMKIQIDRSIDLTRDQVCVACPYLWELKLRKDKRIKWSDRTASRNNSETISFRAGEREYNCRIEFIPDYSDMGGFNPARGVGYAFTKESIALVYGVTLVGNIGWVPRHRSFRASGYMERDAVAQRPDGIVKILGQTA